MSVWAVLVAAGRGERLGEDRPKAFVRLGDLPLLAEPLRRLDECEWIDHVVVVAPPEWEEPAILLAEEIGASKAGACVTGGETRTESVRLGVAEVADDAAVIVVHDAARPFAGADLFDAVVAEARTLGAALAATPVADTLKEAHAGRVTRTLARAGLWQAQTPQAVRRELLVEAHARARADGVLATDDVALVERLGHPVGVVPVHAPNPKVTTAADLAWAEAWLAAQAARS